MMPHRKLLDDMDERSMPDIPGMTWHQRDELDQARERLIDSMVTSLHPDQRQPIRVQAEVGRPVGEIES